MASEAELHEPVGAGVRAAPRPLAALAAAGRAVRTTVALACFTAFLLVTRGLLVWLGPFYLALDKLGGARAIARAPLPVLLGANAALFALCRHAGPAGLDGSRWTWVRLVAFPFFLVCSGLALGGVVAAPLTLAALRERVATRFPERWIGPKLANALDAHFVVRLVVHAVVVTPAFVALFLPATRGPFAVAYWAVTLNLLAASHEALDHSNIHNHFFRTSHLARRRDRLLVGGLGLYLDYVLNPLCGRIPNWYRVQHVAVHHAEDNGPDDTQSTLPYDRLSFFDTATAALSFAVSMVFPLDVVRYLARKRRARPLRRLVASMVGWYAAVGLLALVYWPSALVVLGMRFVFGLAGTLTYYQWHVFADPADPKNAYTNSVNNADPSTDHGYVGAALHIEHHLHMARHWSQLAEDARANAATYEREAVLQLASGRHPLLRALFRRRFDELGPMLVGFDGQPLEAGRLRALVWARTRPLAAAPKPRLARWLDERVGSALATVLLLPIRRSKGLCVPRASD